MDYASCEKSLLPSNNKFCANTQHDLHEIPEQGKTVKSDLPINGAKIFSNATFRSSKISGLPQGQVRTGVGVYFCPPSSQGELNSQVQASAPPTSTPLQAEAVALACAAHLAICLSAQSF